jgi:hypothetical protein
MTMKTPVFKTIVALLSVVMSATAFANSTGPRKNAEGGVHGGGGGLLRQNGQLKTLAEAGIILERLDTVVPKEYPEYYEISEGTQKELREICMKLAPYFVEKANLWPDKNSGADVLFSSAMGGRDTFIRVKSADPKLLASIKADYVKVIKSAGIDLPIDNFELAAFTRVKTYILPNFDELNDRQKALILIHELFMRLADEDYGTYLAKVLVFDSAIYKALTQVQTDESTLKFLKAGRDLGIITKSPEMFQLQMVQNRLNRPLLLSELLLSPAFWPYSLVPNDERNRMDPSLLRKFEAVLPGVAQALDNLEIHYEENLTRIYADRAHDWVDPASLHQYLYNICTNVPQQLQNSRVFGDRFVFIDPQSNNGFVFKCESGFAKDFVAFSIPPRK